MFRPVVVISNDRKSVTIVGAGGNTVSRTAQSTLNVSHRKDGGVTVWADGEHRSQTIRVDAFGRVTNGKRVIL